MYINASDFEVAPVPIECKQWAIWSWRSVRALENCNYWFIIHLLSWFFSTVYTTIWHVYYSSFINIANTNIPTKSLLTLVGPETNLWIRLIHLQKKIYN